MPADAAGAGADLESLLALVDLLARRHALAAFWELRGAAQPFRTLALRLGVTGDRLTQRLRELREAGLVQVDEAGDYRLSSEGRRLLDLLERLADFAAGWTAMTARQRSPRGSRTTGRGEDGWQDD